MSNNTHSDQGTSAAQAPQPENSMTKANRLGAKFGIGLCLALLLAQTGCLPGMHGGPPGLPGLPGLPRGERPASSRVASVTAAGEDVGRNPAPQIVQNETSVDAIPAGREFHE
ncbi:MAG: hypothetical protein JWR69_4688 [Pedosphaera sp.]|nr:hypothetical protein [Pedosphaera sp.]